MVIKMSEELKKNRDSLAEYLKKQRELEAEMQQIRSLIMKSVSEKHNLNSCNCEGCKWYWMSTAVFRDGRFFELYPNIKVLIDKTGVILYLQGFLLHLRKLALVNGQPFWMAYGNNKGMIYKEI